jgi:hypothetical protein
MHATDDYCAFAPPPWLELSASPAVLAIVAACCRAGLSGHARHTTTIASAALSSSAAFDMGVCGRTLNGTAQRAGQFAWPPVVRNALVPKARPEVSLVRVLCVRRLAVSTPGVAVGRMKPVVERQVDRAIAMFLLAS